MGYATILAPRWQHLCACCASRDCRPHPGLSAMPSTSGTRTPTQNRLPDRPRMGRSDVSAVPAAVRYASAPFPTVLHSEWIDVALRLRPAAYLRPLDIELLYPARAARFLRKRQAR